jgi:hypothetical protein
MCGEAGKYGLVQTLNVDASLVVTLYFVSHWEKEFTMYNVMVSNVRQENGVALLQTIRPRYVSKVDLRGPAVPLSWLMFCLKTVANIATDVPRHESIRTFKFGMTTPSG